MEFFFQYRHHDFVVNIVETSFNISFNKPFGTCPYMFHLT